MSKDQVNRRPTGASGLQNSRFAGSGLFGWILKIEYWILLFLFLLAAPFSASAQTRGVSGKWVKLDNATLGDGYMDGDSFYIRHNNKDIIIRLYFVDALETDTQFVDRNQDQADYYDIPLARVVRVGRQATRLAQKTLSGKRFTVWTRWEDARGSSRQRRFFGLVRIGNQDLGELLVAHGLARVYGASTILPDGTSIDNHFARLRQLERRAKAKRLGGWAWRGRKSGAEGMFDLEEDEDAPPSWFEEEEEDVGVYAEKWINVPTVAFLRAEAFINAEQFEDAEIEMRKLIRRFPEHSQKARIEFYLALSIAMQERFEDAVRRFQVWLQSWPNHAMVPDVQYWMPISLYYDGQYEKALPYFDAYAKKYPMSVYAPEATYRAACCRYALEDFERAAADLAAWIEQHPGHYFRHEAAIQRGDALAALGELDDAKAAYRIAMTPDAGPFYAMALAQIARVHKARAGEDDYREMSADYVDFIKNMPDDGNIIDAAYQAGWALRQIGRPDQARRLYWQMIERHGNTPAWEGFDLMLRDLAGLYPRGTDDYATELRARYERALEARRLPLAARLAWAEAQLLPADQQARQLAIFAGRFRTDHLGPETLLWLGRSWIEHGMESSGIPHLEMLLETYPASRQVPEAQTLLAQQSLDAKEYATALAYANEVLANAAEVHLILEATFLRAEALHGLGRWGEAISDYTTILANRAAPRHLKPDALLGIGACLEAQHEYAQAIAYYQRVYVLYRAYRPAVIQAYLRSAACFEQLGDTPAALSTYREFLESDFAPGTAAAAQARQRIATLAGGGS